MLGFCDDVLKHIIEYSNSIFSWCIVHCADYGMGLVVSETMFSWLSLLISFAFIISIRVIEITVADIAVDKQF